ncbi:hypothetical protein SMD11_7037 [Streptomyces albireticuli]|uniref:Uncharacterized protein n=2 Tax=Streptomyces TaxID=1883 RepID=A0A1Z2LE85_9ACTN|nr:hypothetical protein [Streptomyces albireticuli]ARZ72613.1 hypothetical protein SMD11_7037 [Streptomyces albireticuli]
MEFRLSTTTFSADNLLNETVGAVRLITTLSSTGDQRSGIDDLDIHTKADLDGFIAGLHAYATALGQWRDRLPD